MDARWTPVRNENGRDRTSFDVCGVQDFQRSAAIGGVDDEPDEPAVILSRSLSARHEDELACNASRSEVVDVPGPALQIVFQQRRLAHQCLGELFRKAERIGKAIRQPGATTVYGRELLRGVVDRAVLDRSGA